MAAWRAEVAHLNCPALVAVVLMQVAIRDPGCEVLLINMRLVIRQSLVVSLSDGDQ